MVSGIKIDLKIDPENRIWMTQATLGDPLGIPWGPSWLPKFTIVDVDFGA